MSLVATHYEMFINKFNNTKYAYKIEHIVKKDYNNYKKIKKVI